MTYLAAAIIVVVVLTLYFYSTSLTHPNQWKAAIIDQLSSSKLDEIIRHENQTFLEAAKESLYKRFSTVDYFSDNATVEEYKRLPYANYKLIVWRAHSALDLDSKYVAISTTDKYGSKSYDQYLNSEQLTLCNITGDANLYKMYFGITPKFIKEVMNGRFEDTIIIFMSCNGLKNGYHETANAFEERGVKVFISWDGWVSFFDNDNAVTLLLQYLVGENDTVSAAVDKIPAYLSDFGWTKLRYDPNNTEAADYRLPNYKENGIAMNTSPMTLTIFRKIENHLRSSLQN